MRVLVTGATGLIGKEIVKLLHQSNIEVHYLTTRKNKIETSPNYKGFYWNPRINEIDSACIQGVDAIINLVGATVSKRWTTSYKKEIIESRTKSAELLFETLNQNDHKINHIISASAIGIYPNSYTNYYDESYQDIDDSFLGEVVRVWEEAIDAFKKLSLKVSKIRIGLVLSDKGGALPEIVRPIKLGAGAAFGSGKQWQSWIHIEDLSNIFKFVLDNNIEGTINAVAPNPVTNDDLTKIAAKVLNRPLILPNIPKSVMKLALGEMHYLLYASQRVCSKKIENLGYNFKYYLLEPALENLLQIKKPHEAAY